jgi:hypothetical protein
VVIVLLFHLFKEFYLSLNHLINFAADLLRAACSRCGCEQSNFLSVLARDVPSPSNSRPLQPWNWLEERVCTFFWSQGRINFRLTESSEGFQKHASLRGSFQLWGDGKNLFAAVHPPIPLVSDLPEVPAIPIPCDRHCLLQFTTWRQRKKRTRAFWRVRQQRMHFPLISWHY